MTSQFISKKVRRRFVIISAITILFYWIFIYLLFFLKEVFQSLIFLFLFFLVFHFFFIELKNYKKKYFLIWLFMFSVWESLILWFEIWQYLASLWIFNIWIIILISDLDIPLKQRISFNTISYFSIWWYLFTITTAITYSFALVWMYSQFPFNCNNLSSASDRIIWIFTQPLEKWIDKVNEIKNNTQQLLQDSLEKIIMKDMPKNVDLNISDFIVEYKQILIDQVIQDNSSINLWICEYILSEINKRYDKPVFQFSSILLMYLLFYPFLRIIYWIISLIWSVIFQLLFFLKVYKIEKIQKEIEELN
jgi:hypothetical protein